MQLVFPATDDHTHLLPDQKKVDMVAAERQNMAIDLLRIGYKPMLAPSHSTKSTATNPSPSTVPPPKATGKSSGPLLGRGQT